MLEVISESESQASAPATVSPRTACSILVQWANAQDHWVRGIVGDIIETRQEPSPEALEEAYQAFLVGKGLASGEAEEIPPLGVVDGEVEAVEPFQLTKLLDVVGATS